MPTVRASDVMDLAASFLNDSDKSVFFYSAQLPYLKSAYDELAQVLEANNIEITNELSAVLHVTTAMTDIGGSTGPALPSDLIEIQRLLERLTGTTNDFTEITKVRFLPATSVLGSTLNVWTWQNQIIRFLGATTNRDVKIEYVGNTLGVIVDETTIISYFNAKNFLAYRTAALCALYIGENPTRAGQLEGDAEKAKDIMLDINVKSGQSMPVRRRPFMAGYKQRGSGIQ